MANEKTVAKESFLTKVAGFFKNKIAKAFKDMWHELKKVTWPSKKDLITYSIVVVVFMVFMAIVIGLLDLGATELVDLLSRI